MQLFIIILCDHILLQATEEDPKISKRLGDFNQFSKALNSENKYIGIVSTPPTPKAPPSFPYSVPQLPPPPHQPSHHSYNSQQQNQSQQIMYNNRNHTTNNVPPHSNLLSRRPIDQQKQQSFNGSNRSSIQRPEPPSISFNQPNLSKSYASSKIHRDDMYNNLPPPQSLQHNGISAIPSSLGSSSTTSTIGSNLHKIIHPASLNSIFSEMKSLPLTPIDAIGATPHNPLSSNFNSADQNRFKYAPIEPLLPLEPSQPVQLPSMRPPSKPRERVQLTTQKS